MEYKCSICLDKLFTADTDVSVTPCGHAFHGNCISRVVHNNPECPKCRREISGEELKEIYFDVFGELDHSDCSPATVDFLEQIKEREREKKIDVLNSVKTLDKESKILKEAYKENRERYETCKLFLRSFQKDRKNWREKNRKLKLVNNSLYAEIRKLYNEKEEKESHDESPKADKIDKMSEDIINNIDKMINKGFLIIIV